MPIIRRPGTVGSGTASKSYVVVPAAVHMVSYPRWCRNGRPSRQNPKRFVSRQCRCRRRSTAVNCAACDFAIPGSIPICKARRLAACHAPQRRRSFHNRHGLPAQRNFAAHDGLHNKIGNMNGRKRHKSSIANWKLNSAKLFVSRAPHLSLASTGMACR